MVAEDGGTCALKGWSASSIVMSQESCSKPPSSRRWRRLHADMLKWKSQEITKAKTIQARRKFRNLWPCQKFRISGGRTVAVAAATSDVSFHCSINSASLAPETFRATDPHISQILQWGYWSCKINTMSKIKTQNRDKQEPMPTSIPFSIYPQVKTSLFTYETLEYASIFYR